MRLDKYLKVSRLIKRRTIAKEACDGGKISINGKVAKAGSAVAVDDIISLTFGDKVTKYRVLAVKEHVRKEDVDQLYQPVE